MKSNGLEETSEESMKPFSYSYIVFDVFDHVVRGSDHVIKVTQTWHSDV